MVTQGILQVLDRDELRGVLAHELSHVKNRDILIGSVAAAVALAITFVASIALWGAMFGGGDDGDRRQRLRRDSPMAILAPIAAGLLQMSLSRSPRVPGRRERRAPAARRRGAWRVPSRRSRRTRSSVPMDVNPAQAQAYIVNPLTGRKVEFANLFSTAPAHRRAHRPAAQRPVLSDAETRIRRAASIG